MWTAKIKFNTEKALIGSKAINHKVSLFAFPLSFSYDKNSVLVQIACTIFGSEKNKKDFVKNLKKESRVINLELNDDFLIGLIKEPLVTKCIYNKDIIHLSPVLISEEGFEIAHISAFNKQSLIDVVNVLKPLHGVKLLSIQQKKINSISIMTMRPELTKKQRFAMELAIQKGYYHSPRNIDLQSLAKLADLSFSTYQVHLRKAEEKLIPYWFEK